MLSEESFSQYSNPHAAMMEQSRAEHAARKAAIAEEKKREAEAEVARRKQAFMAHVSAFEGGVEAALASQAQLLHGIFAHAVDEYAAAPEEHKAKLYSAIALRAQNYCRMTLTAAAKLKNLSAHAIMTGEKTKIEDPAIKGTQHEAVDGGGTPAAEGNDPAVAAVENGSGENGSGQGGEPQECAEDWGLQPGDKSDPRAAGAMSQAVETAE
jgi:hypothetical protein